MNKSYLDINHWNFKDGLYIQTMTSKELKDTLLNTSGSVFKNGALYTVHSKKIGPGVYNVWLEHKLG